MYQYVSTAIVVICALQGCGDGADPGETSTENALNVRTTKTTPQNAGVVSVLASGVDERDNVLTKSRVGIRLSDDVFMTTGDVVTRGGSTDLVDRGPGNAQVRSKPLFHDWFLMNEDGVRLHVDEGEAFPDYEASADDSGDRAYPNVASWPPNVGLLYARYEGRRATFAREAARSSYPVLAAPDGLSRTCWPGDTAWYLLSLFVAGQSSESSTQMQGPFVLDFWPSQGRRTVNRYFVSQPTELSWLENRDQGAPVVNRQGKIIAAIYAGRVQREELVGPWPFMWRRAVWTDIFTRLDRDDVRTWIEKKIDEKKPTVD